MSVITIIIMEKINRAISMQIRKCEVMTQQEGKGKRTQEVELGDTSREVSKKETRLGSNILVKHLLFISSLRSMRASCFYDY